MNVFVNATAARSSGALTILNQFIENIIRYNREDDYYIFIAPNMSFPLSDSLHYVVVSTTSWVHRIWWDGIGFKKWIKRSGVIPNLIVSLQNTGVNYSEVPTLIYYHQPLPLVEHRWSFFIKKERILYLYKNLYGFFVKKYLSKETHIVVQIPSIKDAFIKKFKVDPSNVHIIRPDIPFVDCDLNDIVLDSNYIHLLYPATPNVYKNHKFLIQLLAHLKDENVFLLELIRLHLTLEEKSDPELTKLILEYGLTKNVVFEGVMKPQRLKGFYMMVDALLFPSYIETFGLPLIEAASVGLPILVSDLPYSRDVIGDYDGAIFLELNNMEEWEKALLLVHSEKKKYSPYVLASSNGWEIFFKLIDELKYNHNSDTNV